MGMNFPKAYDLKKEGEVKRRKGEGRNKNEMNLEKELDELTRDVKLMKEESKRNWQSDECIEMPGGNKEINGRC